MRNHGVSRIHRPSTDHRSVFDLGLINERSPRPRVQSLRGSTQPSADAGSAIRPARPQKSRLVRASYGRVCGVSRRARADTRSPVRGPSPAGAGGQSRKSGPRRPAASVGIAAHAMSGELRFCPRRRTLLATAPLLHGAGCRGGSRAPWRVSVHRLSGRSWRSAAVSVFTHVTNGAGASIWRAQVGQVLGDARSLYGAAPQECGRPRPGALSRAARSRRHDRQEAPDDQAIAVLRLLAEQGFQEPAQPPKKKELRN